MRRDRGTTSFSNTLPGFQVGFAALVGPESTVGAELVEIIEPAGARPVRTRVGNTEPGRVALGGTDTGKLELPVARQVRGIGYTIEPELPSAAADVDPDGQAVADQFDHFVIDEGGCIGRRGQLRAVHDLGEAEV